MLDGEGDNGAASALLDEALGADMVPFLARGLRSIHANHRRRRVHHIVVGVNVYIAIVVEGDVINDASTRRRA